MLPCILRGTEFFSQSLRSWEKFVCPGRDSNSHGLLHTILSRTRKPFRHPGFRCASSAAAAFLYVDDDTEKM